MLLLLDSMGKRYGSLPSVLYRSADTFDLLVMDCALTYEKYKSDQQNKKYNSELYDEEELQQRLNSVRNEN